MSGDRGSRIRSLFRDALDVPADQRGDFLDSACGGDDALRREVEALLAADSQADGFLEPPTRPGPLAAAAPAAPAAGDQVGAYTIIRPIASGGMGTVYEAEQSQLGRRVALKVIRTGLMSPETVERFVREAEILARLQHPGIARIYEAGVHRHAGAPAIPYFAMDLVDGAPLSRYLDTHAIELPARLRLFRGICAAVQYAHQKLVIHRDLKPANILVTPAGEPVLLDFGVAKLLEETDQAAAQTLTRQGGSLLTPEYASPEQVRGDEVTTASDVYSLGVILYELLAGRRPYDLEGRRPSEVERTICETAPAPPSAAAAASPRLRRRLRGDLDNIVLMALRKEPQRRYDSVQQLSEDVRRHVAGLPVMARADTFAYRAAKFVRRHALPVAAATAVVLALAGGMIATARQAAITARQRDAAETARRQAERINGLLRDILAAADPGQALGEELTVAQVLAQAAERVERELADEPLVRAALRDTIGMTYLSLGMLDPAEPHLRDALATRERLLGESSHETALSIHNLGSLLARRGAFDDAEPLFRRALRIERSIGGAADDVASCMDSLARLLDLRGDYDEAERLYRESLAMRRDYFGRDNADVAASLNNLAVLLKTRGDLPEAEKLMRQAIRAYDATLGEEHPLSTNALNNLGALLNDMGRYDEAIEVLTRALDIRRRVLGPLHPDFAVSLLNLGAMLTTQGRHERAESLLREALDVTRSRLGDDHAQVGICLMNLGQTLRGQAKLDEAAESYRDALRIIRLTFPENHVYEGHCLLNLARVLRDMGRLDEAESMLHDAESVYRAALGGENRHVASCRFYLGKLWQARGDHPRAIALLREALNLRRSVLPDGHPVTQSTQTALADELTAAGEYAEAERLLLDLLPPGGVREADAPDTPGAPDAEETSIESDSSDSPDPSALAPIHARLADLYDAWNRPRQAARHRAATQPTGKELP